MSELQVSRPQRLRDVEIRTSAGAEQIGLLRSFAVDVAMRMDFDLDRVEDLRVVVGEACSVLVQLSRPDSDMTCRLVPGEADLRVRLSVEADRPTPASADPLGWQIIRTLADDVSEEVEDCPGGYRVTLELVTRNGGTNRGE